ncbi:cytochrome c [Neobacillus sp. PS3-12]|uniref:cytochrome c551 n=1 Tax=Neobacillus sp. PS3-12 TaxID=3070677 RepID=UPI0027E1E56E|nr:cytochrome c [Neobacillus sp. PS3-12]WML54725.1 cytochrome c [Neobacillus sp. PS3-12]
MKRKLLTLIMGATVVMGLAACGGGSSSKSTDTASADPQKIVNQKCSSCHGDQLQGVVGPNLQKIGSKYSKAEILDIIKNGKGGGKMPAGLISGNDADKVAEWLAAKK